MWGRGADVYTVQAVNNPAPAQAAARAVTAVSRRRNCRDCPPGLYPYLYTPHDAAPANRHVTISGLGDSFYEYLLKAFIQARGHPSYTYLLEMWQEAMDGTLLHLMRSSPASNLTYLADLRDGYLVHRFGHLACFVPGLLALGAPYAATGRESSGGLRGVHPQDAYMAAAEGLMRTCAAMYEQSPTGLSPEIVFFRHVWSGIDMTTDPDSAYNILRPETVESLFILYRRTGDEKYRRWGWSIFQAFEKYCRVEGGGYSGLKDVRAVPPVRDDVQQSFFLAETLKWVYFSVGDILFL